MTRFNAIIVAHVNINAELGLSFSARHAQVCILSVMRMTLRCSACPCCTTGVLYDKGRTPATYVNQAISNFPPRNAMQNALYE